MNAIQALSQLSYGPGDSFSWQRPDRPAASFVAQTRVVKASSKPAGPTGLEPATSGVTVRHSNRLSYGPLYYLPPRRRPASVSVDQLLTPRPAPPRMPRTHHQTHPTTGAKTLQQSGQPGSNRRPQPWQGCALPTELCPHHDSKFTIQNSKFRSHPTLPRGIEPRSPP